MRASCASMLGLHASCSFFTDINLQSSLTRIGHRAVKFQTRTEGSLMPTICPEGVCLIIQIFVLIIVGPFVSRVKLSIPPVFVPVVIKRNREHHWKCFVDVWNVVGQDSDSSRCDWSRRFARSIKYGMRCEKIKRNRQIKQLAVIVLGFRTISSLWVSGEVIDLWDSDNSRY